VRGVVGCDHANLAPGAEIATGNNLEIRLVVIPCRWPWRQSERDDSAEHASRYDASDNLYRRH
jgi:hypothetical protein